ncbi:hypothetical protein JCM11491_006861 [Sporobolomyces phaffii]
MQNVEIRHLDDLSPKYRAHLLKAQYTTAAEVLLTPVHHLRHRTSLPSADVEQLVADVSRAVLARPDAACASVAHLVNDDRQSRGAKIAFGDREIDLLFDGGVRVGSLTEIAGQSAAGKTHLCLQLALRVQLPRAHGGLDGGALFISSEGTLSSDRLLSLAAHLPKRDDDDDDDALTTCEWDYLDNIHTEKAPDVDTLEAVVAYHVPAAIERINHLAKTATVDPDLAKLTGHGTGGPDAEVAASEFLAENRASAPRPPLPIRLVVLDSIAAPVRATHENASAGFVERSKELVSIGDKLKRIAHVYACAVVVVNQVQDVFERTGPLPPHLVVVTAAAADDGGPTVPPSSSSARYLAAPAPATSLSRASSTSSRYSSATTGGADPDLVLPPPHVQYGVPDLLYTRYQSRHSTGAAIPAPLASSSSSSGSRVSAALGTTWTNLVNTRALCRISRRDRDRSGNDSTTAAVLRDVTVVFGPDVKRGRVGYALGPAGVTSVGPVEWRDELWRVDSAHNDDDDDDDDDDFGMDLED